MAAYTHEQLKKRYAKEYIKEKAGECFSFIIAGAACAAGWFLMLELWATLGGWF